MDCCFANISDDAHFCAATTDLCGSLCKYAWSYFFDQAAHPMVIAEFTGKLGEACACSEFGAKQTLFFCRPPLK